MSTTLAESPRRSTAEGFVRLRSACDACSIAKIKCNKKSPCGRCRANNYTCLYSPSRRHGKQSWATWLAMQQQPQRQQQYPQPSWARTSISIPALPPSFLADSTSNLIPPSMATISQPSHGDIDMETAELHRRMSSATYCSSAQSSLSGLELGDFDFLSQWSGGESPVDLTSASSSTGNPSHDAMTSQEDLTSTNFSTDTMSFKPSDSAVHDCENKAFTTLQSLHFYTTNDSDGSMSPEPGKPSCCPDISSRMPPLDKVLSSNRAAVCTLKQLLDCPCTKQPHLALLYTAIVSKALFWYRLAISPHNNASSPTSPRSAAYGQQSQSNLASRAMKPATIQIGMFDLEEEDEKLLMRSVLMQELKKLEAVVDRINNLGNGTARDVCGEEAPYMPNWYTTCGTELKSEIRDTVGMIKSMASRRSAGR